jgi:MarR-like DNA-binding transcriptional regulator SgrR of sgrS sRNA
MPYNPFSKKALRQENQLLQEVNQRCQVELHDARNDLQQANRKIAEVNDWMMKQGTTSEILATKINALHYESGVVRSMMSTLSDVLVLADTELALATERGRKDSRAATLARLIRETVDRQVVIMMDDPLPQVGGNGAEVTGSGTRQTQTWDEQGDDWEQNKPLG